MKEATGLALWVDASASQLRMQMMSGFNGRIHLFGATALDHGDHISGCRDSRRESIVFVILKTSGNRVS